MGVTDTKRIIRRSTLCKIDVVLESVSNGVSLEKSCLAANISRPSFYGWMHEEPENKEKYYEELGKCTHAVESALYKSALEGNTTSMIFWLTNRAPRNWIHKRVQEIKADILNHAAILDELEEED